MFGQNFALSLHKVYGNLNKCFKTGKVLQIWASLDRYLKQICNFPNWFGQFYTSLNLNREDCQINKLLKKVFVPVKQKSFRIAFF